MSTRFPSASDIVTLRCVERLFLEPPILNRRFVFIAALGAVLAAVLAFRPLRSQLVPVVGMIVNYARTLNAPAGTLTVEAAQPTGDPAPVDRDQSWSDPLAPTQSTDWPSYNRTLTSVRYSPLDQINRQNVAELKVLESLMREFAGRISHGAAAVPHPERPENHRSRRRRPEPLRATP